MKIKRNGMEKAADWVRNLRPRMTGHLNARENCVETTSPTFRSNNNLSPDHSKCVAIKKAASRKERNRRKTMWKKKKDRHQSR